MMRRTCFPLCAAVTSATATTGASSESMGAKMKRQAKEQGSAFTFAFVIVNIGVISTLYAMVCMGLDTSIIRGADSIWRAIGWYDPENSFEQKFKEDSAKKEGSRWAITMTLYSCAPIAPITFPLYGILGAKIARWGPYVRYFRKATPAS